MKKVILAVALLTAGSNLYAQDNKQANIETPEQKVERMDKAVSLTEQQKSDLTKVFFSFQQRLDVVMNQGKAEDIDKNLDELLQGHNQQLKQFLTEEQYSKWIAASASK